MFGRKKKSDAPVTQSEAMTADERLDEADLADDVDDQPDDSVAAEDGESDADDADARGLLDDDETDADDADDAEDGFDTDEDGSDTDEEDEDEPEEEPTDEWEELQQSQDWREDGPFDIDEVELEGDEVERMDFGSLIITPEENVSLQLQVEQETGNVQAALAMIGNSGLELALFAAPRSGGLAKTVRDEMLASVEQTGGSCEFGAGPFGAEVRRMVPVRTPDGQDAVHASRTWLAEGPRWLLRGVLMGEAAVSDDTSLQEPFVEFFKNVVVRRGDNPLPEGDLIPMTLPDELKPVQQ